MSTLAAASAGSRARNHQMTNSDSCARKLGGVATAAPGGMVRKNPHRTKAGIPADRFNPEKDEDVSPAGAAAAASSKRPALLAKSTTKQSDKLTRVTVVQREHAKRVLADNAAEVAAATEQLREVKQKLDTSVEHEAALQATVTRLQEECSGAAGRAKASDAFIVVLKDQLDEVKQRTGREATALAERLLESNAEAASQATEQAQAQAQAALKKIQEEHVATLAAHAAEATDLKKRLREMEDAAAAAPAAAAVAAAVVAPAVAPAAAPAAVNAAEADGSPPPKKRRKQASVSGSGRSMALPDVPYQMAAEAIKPLDYENHWFFQRLSITDPASMHRKFTTFLVNQAKMSNVKDIKDTKAQCKQKAETFLRMLSLETGKYPTGNVEDMCAYLLGDEDIGKGEDQFYNRKYQVATWLWPDLVTTYASFRDPAPESRKVYTLAHKHLTGVRALWTMYQWFKEGKAMPAAWAEGDPVLPPKQKRAKNAAASSAAAAEADSGSEGDEEGEEADNANEAGQASSAAAAYFATNA